MEETLNPSACKLSEELVSSRYNICRTLHKLEKEKKEKKRET